MKVKRPKRTLTLGDVALAMGTDTRLTAAQMREALKETKSK